MSASGILFLVAGPSGAGKSTVLRRFLKSSSNLERAISVTTRASRTGEKNGKDYHFWSRPRFEKAVSRGAFLEHAVVHGTERYGTLKRFVSDRLEAGVDVIKDIDVQGVAQIRRIMPHPLSVAIFLAPPEPRDLAARLSKRGSEGAPELARRLASARREMRRIGEYDYLVLNQEVGQAVEELRAIRRSEQLRPCRLQAAFKKAWFEDAD